MKCPNVRSSDEAAAQPDTMNQGGQEPHLYKVALLGDSGTGKSSILHSCADRAFDPHRDPTIGVDFLVKTIQVRTHHQQHTVRLQMWDLSGQPRFRSLANTYARGVKGLILVYDVTRADSFEGILTEWVPIRDAVTRLGLATVLLGNKTDAVELGNPREVTFAQGQQMAHRIGAKFMEVSALSGLNCNPMLRELTRDMVVARQVEEDTRQSTIGAVMLQPVPPPGWNRIFQFSIGWKSCLRPTQ
eukprot:m.340967 g.340967  ORF g.340967 m.340967 type:complete len:244 (-) comp27833_c0_seq1:121-852(-)